ncbi:MAG: sigma-70 family RNA polymerase sigma factor [Pseudomonadota bacterium]
MQSFISHRAPDVFREHRVELIDLASAITGSRAQSEDIVQEAFLQFSRQSETQAIRSPYAYLVGIVRRLSVEVIRRQVAEGKVFNSSVTDEAWQTIPSDATDPETALALQEEYLVFRSALSELPSITRRAILMHYVEGMTVREIATRLNVSVGKAHTIIKEGALHCQQRVRKDTE